MQFSAFFALAFAYDQNSRKKAYFNIFDFPFEFLDISTCLLKLVQEYRSYL